MKILNFLNISRNRLVGSIPLEIEGLLSLTSVDFSNNNLLGLVPGTGQFSYFNAVSSVGNPELRGPYLGPCNDISASKEALNKGPLFSTFKLFLVIGLLICSMALAIDAVIKERALEKANTPRQWKLTAFQRLDFSCDDVLESLKEDNIIGRGSRNTILGRYAQWRRSCCENGWSSSLGYTI